MGLSVGLLVMIGSVGVWLGLRVVGCKREKVKSTYQSEHI